MVTEAILSVPLDSARWRAPSILALHTQTRFARHGQLVSVAHGNVAARESPAHVSVPCEALFTDRAFREPDQKALRPPQKKNGNWR